MGTGRKPDAEATQNMMNMWRKDINELMAWLDWNAWVKCRPECGPGLFLLDDAFEHM
ncbi:hypothetical protein PISMIDRAFT_681233, partial [Pisolithus microcarpus 441]